jgi:DNA polymerase-3 subunit beta
MHITVEHERLRQALELAARISTKHISLPVLQCVLLEVKDAVLTVRATNLEVGMHYAVPIEKAGGTEDGIVCVAASTLLQTVALISQSKVALKREGEMLVVETPTSRSSLSVVPYEDFPTIPQVEKGGQPVNRKTFAEGIGATAFAASQSSIKPELGSVYVFQKKEHSLTFVATDSFRLVEKTVPQQQVALESGILVPYKNALELAHVCELMDDDPELMVNENQCALKFRDVTIVSRLVSGTFPDYESIIPKEFTTHTTLLAGDLQQSLRKTSIFLNKFMQLTFNATKNALVVTSKSEVGTTTERMPAATEGEDITLSFNQRYIQEILPHVSDESVTMHFAGVGRAIVIEGVHDRSLRYLVMPMNK